MAEKRVILVTGITSYWGGQVAAQLAAFPDYHVIGLDPERPKQDIKDLDFIQADIRNPLMIDLLRSEMVDTVVHLAITEPQQPSEASFDLNVMGTMKVLGACAQAMVRKVVIKSTTAVYGALPTNPSFLTEEHPLKGSQSYGYTRDMVEVEAFCNGFRRQVPDMIMTVLRFPSIIGPTADTPMTRFLKEVWTPVLLGFDPMMQVIHEGDVLGALMHAVENDVPGVYNVAAEGVMPLQKMMALAGKMPVPIFHLFAYWGANLVGSGALRALRMIPMELDYIRYPWVADLTRMRTEMCFTPHYTAEEALREFAGHQRMSIYKPEAASLAYDEERLRDTIDRRSRARKRQAAHSAEGGEEND